MFRAGILDLSSGPYPSQSTWYCLPVSEVLEAASSAAGLQQSTDRVTGPHR